MVGSWNVADLELYYLGLSLSRLVAIHCPSLCLTENPCDYHMKRFGMSSQTPILKECHQTAAATIAEMAPALL